MALGTDIEAVGYPNQKYDAVCPVSITCIWQTIIAAGGPGTQDAATITNPNTQITNSTTHVFKRGGRGTVFFLRLGYDDGLTGITDPVVKVFGRGNSADVWQLLPTEGGALTGTLTTAATDVTDGTLNYTTCGVLAQAWDCLGCEEIIVGIQTALAGLGVTNNSIIQAKII